MKTRQQDPVLLIQLTVPAASDTRLVQDCLTGSEQAWSALIDKYKNLIYSIPIKYHLGAEDAADIFQSVCLELFSQLPRLRHAESLRSWLIKVAMHKCLHWKHKQRRFGIEESNIANPDNSARDAPDAAELIEEVEREQIVREAVARLPGRCRELIQMLFFEQPPVPYTEIARCMGLATGSIGFIRKRCLKRFQELLEEMGF